MTTTVGSGNPGWDDPEKTLPPIPDEDPPKVFGPDVPSGYGDFRFAYSVCATKIDTAGLEVHLRSTAGSAVHFMLDHPLVSRIAPIMRRQLAIDRHLLQQPGGPPIPQANLTLGNAPIRFEASDDPTLWIEKDSGGDRIGFSLRSRRASLQIAMQPAVAFNFGEWLSDAEMAGGSA